jgi:pellino protein
MNAAWEHNEIDGELLFEFTDDDFHDLDLTEDAAHVVHMMVRGWKGEFGQPTASYAFSNESMDVTQEELDAADLQAETEGIGTKYGQLVVLGYKEYRVDGSNWTPHGERNEKFVLGRRPEANGIRKDAIFLTPVSGHTRSAYASHSVTMSVNSRSSTGHVQRQQVTIEYVPDVTKDMFQLGRLLVPQNDFVIRGPLHQDPSGVLCGPVSRYAARIVCSRTPPYEVRILAAGFNNDRDIFLSDSAPKWQEGTEWDALTTFGMRLWTPETGIWREVSVNGAIHEPRTVLTSAGVRVPDQYSLLTNGCVIDLAGVQLLYESPESMDQGNSVTEDQVYDEFNKRRPQCPVQMHTIRFDAAAAAAHNNNSGDSRLPYIFPACGHVHAYSPQLEGRPCPLCRKVGPFKKIELLWEPAICKDGPTVCFNPCGHIVSEPVAQLWSRLLLPDNAPPNARYRPACPFCVTPLKTDGEGEGPHTYSRIIFQEEDGWGADLDSDDDLYEGKQERSIRSVFGDLAKQEGR